MSSQLHFWWGEVPEWPENLNEATDVGESQGRGRPMRLPSVGLPCR